MRTSLACVSEATISRTESRPAYRLNVLGSARTLDTSALRGGLPAARCSPDRQAAHAGAAAATTTNSVATFQRRAGERLEAVNFLSSRPIHWPVGGGAERDGRTPPSCRRCTNYWQI